MTWLQYKKDKPNNSPDSQYNKYKRYKQDFFVDFSHGLCSSKGKRIELFIITLQINNPVLW
jgi:hypothetical protein